VHRSNHPHLPKDNEEVNAHVKRLQAMMEAATVADAVHDQENGDRGHEDDHQQSPRGDSANSVTPSDEHDQGHGRDNRDLRDVIHGRDARGRIENRRSAMSRNCTMKVTMTIMAPTMTNLTGSVL
jgi:hypothetical protein